MINVGAQSPYLNYAGEELSAVSRRDGSKCFKRLVHLNIQQMSRDIYSGAGSRFSSPSSSFFFLLSQLYPSTGKLEQARKDAGQEQKTGVHVRKKPHVCLSAI